VLNRTFGRVRVVWNRTLAARHARYVTERRGTSYAETDRALTVTKKDPDLAFLKEVSSVPLQQALDPHVGDRGQGSGRALVRDLPGRGPDPGPLPAAGQDAGVDVGLTDFAVLSTGEKIGHPKAPGPAPMPAEGS
jgi:transposase